MARATPLNPESCPRVVNDPNKWRVSAVGECVIWVGVRSRSGYGRVMVDGGQKNAHRVALVAHLGVDVDGWMVVDHLCRNTSCVNPLHLEAVTDRTNILRGMGLASTNARKVECPRGHPLEAGNLLPASLRRGERTCATCHERKSILRNALIKAAVHATGLTHDAYRKAHGTSTAAALAVLGISIERWEEEGGAA